MGYTNFGTFEFANSIREDFETLRKAVPATSLFLSYMEPLSYVSRGKRGEEGTGKRDYRNQMLLWWIGIIVHRDLFYWSGQKRENQL